MAVYLASPGHGLVDQDEGVVAGGEVALPDPLMGPDVRFRPGAEVGFEPTTSGY
jgi:hypothetical protein